MIQAILFDFNGVIINDEPIHMRAYQEVFKGLGLTLGEKDYYDGLGMDDATFVRHAFSRIGKQADEAAIPSIIERKTELHGEFIKDELPLFPGVVTFIKAVARRYDTGIVSMARRVEVHRVLVRAQLQSYFTVVLTAEDATACKPDPCCYQRALELLNEKRRAGRKLPLLPEECLVIEDAPPGIRSALSAGMRTLGVTNTVSEEALREAGAEVVTASLADWTVDAIYHVFDRR